MHLRNATSMSAAYAMGQRPDARELLVVVVKGSFSLDTRSRSIPAQPELAPVQAPVVLADTFEGEPGFSATVDESDLSYWKPSCDLIFRGCAHAPLAKPVASIDVGLVCGPIDKRFVVTGSRTWQSVGVGVGVVPSLPEPFVRQRFSYSTAFGGIDKPTEDPASHAFFLANPVGVGYHPASPREKIIGKPVPNTHAIGETIAAPSGSYRPMALGPIGRAWGARPRLAGTYDQHWLEHVSPFLPADFDERYFQCSPADQQMPHPKGGEVVQLINLTPAGLTSFLIPSIEVPIEVTDRNAQCHELRPVIDTVTVEPELERFSVVWRASMPLRRGMHELRECIVGVMSPAWRRARLLGKTYYPSLAALAAATYSDAENRSDWGGDSGEEMDADPVSDAVDDTSPDEQAKALDGPAPEALERLHGTGASHAQADSGPSEPTASHGSEAKPPKPWWKIDDGRTTP
ncbi:MAG: DUF2169 domain-containing protein [Planctomycetota bacterium]|nr:DUF2169 domain-containing protein [Planctomycetota bacterium]